MSRISHKTPLLLYQNIKYLKDCGGGDDGSDGGGGGCGSRGVGSERGRQPSSALRYTTDFLKEENI